MVSGKYAAEFADASHVVFNGCLDDPSFRRIAIQRIVKLDGTSVTVEGSGTLEIETRKGRQRVKTSYVCPIYGRTIETVGHPFKDEHTDAIGAQGETP